MQALDQVYQKNQNFVYRQIDDETLLVPIKDSVGDLGSIYNLNQVAAFVWEHLDGKRTLQDIKHLMTDEFEVSDSDAEQDLSEFVDQLENIDAIFPKPHRGIE
jgi:methyltransferase-like protein